MFFWKINDKSLVCQKFSRKLLRYLVTSRLPYKLLSENFTFSLDYIDFTSRVYVKNVYRREGSIMFKASIAINTSTGHIFFQRNLVPKYTTKCCTCVPKQCFHSHDNIYSIIVCKLSVKKYKHYLLLQTDIFWNFNITETC